MVPKKGVVLTKDNLARRNWNADTRCSFCHSPKSIHHLFIECFYTKFLWRTVHLVFGISPPLSIDDLFVNWSKVGGTIHSSLLLTAASALCWTIWITRNEVVFDKCRPNFFFASTLQRNPLAAAMGKTVAAWWSTGPADICWAAFGDISLAFL